MSKMPAQRPSTSRQDYETPDDILLAVKNRLHIEHFAMDVAASPTNAVTTEYYTEQTDGLANPWAGEGWNWCNPPFGQLALWVKKAKEEAERGASTVMLVPASVGSNWYASWVEPYAFVSYLNPRLTFKGATDPYPKDLMLLFYTPWGFTGNEVWFWKARCTKT